MLSLTLYESIIEVLILTIPVLLVVAFVTVAERKTMASMQRRLGPNIVGYYGLLQAFADALKLLLKEYVSPTQANLVLFFIGPIITLIFSLLGYAVIPYGPGSTLFDFDLGILYMLAVSSLATYGILLAGWSANSKYAFLGSLRSTAQLISYELVLSSAILVVILLTTSLNLTVTIETQKIVWFFIPLFPMFFVFFMASVAETNRAPFDLAEAESELVSGFMTEHSAVIFVFFFLGEYASLVLMCIVVTILFLGGYNIDYNLINSSTHYIENTLVYFDILYNELYIDISSLFNLFYVEFNSVYKKITEYSYWYIYAGIDHAFSSVILNGFSSITLGIKTIIMVFVFIWVRASFPRIRFDQLMFYCWMHLLPLEFGFIIYAPCLLSSFFLLPGLGFF